jgi:acetyl esterase/lipase
MVQDDLEIEAMRKMTDASSPESLLAKYSHIIHTDFTLPAAKGLGDSPITLAIFQARHPRNTNRPVLYYIHGGGQVAGNRFFGMEKLVSFFPDDDDIVFASVEYRRAPEYRAPAGAYDCYAGLVYLAEHATELGIDPSRILIYGVSGGAPLAAATCILARNKQYPGICAQMLAAPMLDDRDSWPSVEQFETMTLWSGRTNRKAWDMVLGPDRGGPDVDDIRCPGRATDLSNLPPAFIDVGECEVFRDSAVAYASQIWKCGGTAEMHVWPGQYHGAFMAEPDVPVSRATAATEKSFIQRALGLYPIA